MPLRLSVYFYSYRACVSRPGNLCSICIFFSCSAVFLFDRRYIFARQERILEVSDSKTDAPSRAVLYICRSQLGRICYSRQVRLVIRGEGNRQQCSCHNHKHFKRILRRKYSALVLPCLFLELLFLYAITFIIDRIASKHRLSYALFGVSIIAAIAIQYVIYKFSLFPTKAPIFKADVAIAMLSFSLSGVLFSKFAAQNQKNLRKPYIFILSLLCVAAGGFSALKLNILVGYQSSEYGRILIFYLSAFMSVLGFTMLCFFIPKLKVISYIGSNTMPILLMHKFPVVFFHTLCPFISERLADKSLFWSAIAALLSIGLCLLVALPIHKIAPFVLGEKMLPRKRSKS